MLRTSITAIEFSPLNVPLLEPFEIAVGKQLEANNVLVSLTLEDGTVGLGEGSPYGPITGETQSTTLAALEEIKSLLLGKDAGNFVGINSALKKELRAQPSARAAVVSALMDAVTRQFGIPLHRWCGGSGSSISTDLTIPMIDPCRAEDVARSIFARGIRTIKCKVGGELATDLERLRGIRKGCPDATIIVDANQCFTPKASLKFLDEMERAGINPAMLEQPVHKDDIDGLSFVRKRSNVPIYADEAVRDTADAWNLVTRGAVDGINVKLNRCGGIVEAMQIASLCRTAGVGLMIGSMVETRLGIATAAHVAAGLGGFSFADLDGHMLLASDPFQGGFIQDGEQLRLQETPGIGVARK